jgi:hypothetical protein
MADDTADHADASRAALALVEAVLREDWTGARYLAAHATLGQLSHVVAFAASGWAAAGLDPLQVVASIRAEQFQIGDVETSRRFTEPPQDHLKEQ